MKNKQEKKAAIAAIHVMIRCADKDPSGFWEVYTGTKSVSTDDFGHRTSQAAREQYLANVRIPADEIRAEKSASYV